MNAIQVAKLTKTFKIYKKQAGLAGSLKSLFHREYEEVRAVDDVSFDIKQGELVGFIDPNGAGKTTTLKMLSGLIFPTSGEVSVLNHFPFDRKPEFLKQISLVMGQKNQLWWDLPPMETFFLNKEIYSVPDQEFKQTLDELVQLMKVEDVINVKVRNLSLGQRMKCELISQILHRPKILFLDEPTIGLDVVMQKKLRQLIREYNQKYQSTILLTSHYMNDVKDLCHRIIVINHGHILYDGSLRSIIEKYAREKRLSIVFETMPSLEELNKLGVVKVYEPPQAVFDVPRSEATKLANYLLHNYQIDDINIEEPEIETIIRELFTKKNI